MAIYIIAVFLCRMDDGSGHDYASGDEHLSSTLLHLFSTILEALVHLLHKLAILSLNAGQGKMLRYEKENCIRPTPYYVHI